MLDRIEIKLRDHRNGHIHSVYVDVFENSLSAKWLSALNNLLANNYLLEKNYCFFGFAQSERNGWYILDQVNRSIAAINAAGIGYHIDDSFTMDNCITDQGEPHEYNVGRNIVQAKFNQLHHYFEELQGISGSISEYYNKADPETKWHIRQLNLLCHEFESWALSWRKEIQAPQWQRPSQLMCWLNAPRFQLDANDYELFGVDTINRPLGGVFVGVNKAIGKHHWEVFNDEGRDSRVGELVTDSLRSQTEASGDFDIEWANNPGEFPWQQARLQQFRQWLVNNGFDPEDRSLTIGHPQVGQVDLAASFGSDKYQDIWPVVSSHIDVWSIRTSAASCEFDYHWSDQDFVAQQIQRIQQGN